MKTILLIEDDKDLVFIIEHLLSGHGFKVNSCTVGPDISEIVKEHTPDLILLDLWIAGHLSTDICKEIKKAFTIPVLIFSASTEIEKAFVDCNADGYIKKPFEIDDLLAIVGLHTI